MPTLPDHFRPILFLAVVLFAGAAVAQAAVLCSTAFSWDEIQARPSTGGRSRSLVRSPTLFMASHEPHAVKNVGDTPATYHVIQWFSPGMKQKTEPR